MASKRISTLKRRKVTVGSLISEMFGRVPAVDNTFRALSVRFDLWRAKDSVDFAKVNYTLTRAIFYASVVEAPDGTGTYGREFLYGATFGKPIVNSAAAFAFAKPPRVKVAKKNGETLTSVVGGSPVETEEYLKTWIDDNESDVFKVARNSLRDGDAYILITNDIQAKLISAEGVDAVYDAQSGKLLGYNRTTYATENDKKVKYVTKYRKQFPYEQVVKYDDVNTDGAVISSTNDEENTGEERPLRLIGFHNEREPGEAYGNSEYQNCYQTMSGYHDLLDHAIRNNLYNSTPNLIFTGITNKEEFLKSNGGQKNEDGTWEFSLGEKEFIVGADGFDGKYLQTVSTASEALSLLQVLFWIICQTSETPEFVMGTAVQSSKASVSEQLPVAIAKAERKRKEFKDFYLSLFESVVWYAKRFGGQTQLDDTLKLTVTFDPIMDDDKKLNIEIVKVLAEEGCITDNTKMVMLGMESYVENVDEEIEKARKENEDKAAKMGEYGPSSSQSNQNPKDELEDENEDDNEDVSVN